MEGQPAKKSKAQNLNVTLQTEHVIRNNKIFENLIEQAFDEQLLEGIDALTGADEQGGHKIGLEDNRFKQGLKELNESDDY